MVDQKRELVENESKVNIFYTKTSIHERCHINILSLHLQIKISVGHVSINFL